MRTHEDKGDNVFVEQLPTGNPNLYGITVDKQGGLAMYYAGNGVRYVLAPRALRALAEELVGIANELDANGGGMANVLAMMPVAGHA